MPIIYVAKFNTHRQLTVAEKRAAKIRLVDRDGGERVNALNQLI